MTDSKHHLGRVLMAVPLILLAAGGLWIASRLGLWLWSVAIGGPTFAEARATGVFSHGVVSGGIAALAGLVAGVGAVAAMIRTRLTLHVHRAINLVGLALLLVFLFTVFTVVAEADARYDGPLASPQPGLLGSYFWTYWLASLLAVGLLVSWVVSMRAHIIGVYTGLTPDRPALGDRIIEDIRIFGHDPQYRGSWMGSVFVHVFILFILPWLLSLRGCVDNYYIPEGSGNPVVMLVQAVKPKKKVKREYILRPESAISFEIPDLDDTEIEKEILKETEREYTAVAARVGAIGVGGGTEGGWPEGMGREPVRFVRLEYRGSEWDDGMGSEGADRAFLDRFEDVTGFKTARSSEAIRIHQLDNFDKGFAPPFVYMTGDRDIGGVSSGERQVLREYLLDGGMLFADAGGRRWDREFRGFIKSVLPDKGLKVIADDDPIFRYPYQFPDGAPPVWAHGGRRALGMKHKGRWIVFYHPGDINDAWKGTQISGLSRHETQGAFEMGLNIIYYAFTHYLEETRRYRK